MRIAEYLQDQQVDFEKLLHPPAYSAQKRAKYLGVSGKQIAKAVLLRGPGGFFLAVLPGPKQVDTGALAAALDGPVAIATEEEIAQVFRDCEWGVVSPFGTLYGLRTVVDASLRPEDWLIFESNSHAEAVKVRCKDYERLERPLRLDFARA